MADAEGLNPSGPLGSCGFESRPGHLELAVGGAEFFAIRSEVGRRARNAHGPGPALPWHAARFESPRVQWRLSCGQD